MSIRYKLFLKYVSITISVLFFIVIFNPLKINTDVYGATPIQVCDGFSYSKAVEPNPLNSGIWITGYEHSTFTGSAAYLSTVHDGNNLWMIPHNSPVKQILKFNVATGLRTQVPFTAGLTTISANSNLFYGGVFDGTYIWLVPYNVNSVIRVKVSDNSMVEYPVTNSGTLGTNLGRLTGCTFDGRYVWMMPYNCNRFLRVDTQSTTIGQMGAYSIQSPADRGNLLDSQESVYWFKGGIFDGTYVWAVPQGSDRVVRILPTSTPSFTGYPLPTGYTDPGSYKFACGVYAKGYSWLIPHNANKIARVNSNGNITYFDISCTTLKTNYQAATFDGDNIWLFHNTSNLFVKYNVDGNNFTSYDFSGPNTTNIGNSITITANRGRSATFDGTNIWLSPNYFNRLIKISPANSVSGKVLEKLTLDPIEGADVYLESKVYKDPSDTSLGKLYYFTSTTDAGGNYNKFKQVDKNGNVLNSGAEVSELPIGEYIVTTVKSGYDPDDTYNPMVETLDVKAAPAINKKDLKLIKPRFLNVRQVVLYSKSNLYVPSKAHINLQNITLDNLLPVVSNYNLKPISCAGIASSYPNFTEIPYTYVRLPIKTPYFGYTLYNITPMNYKTLRYDIGKTINSQAPSLDRKIDFTLGYEYYATIYLSPITSNSDPPYSKMSIQNILGNILRP